MKHFNLSATVRKADQLGKKATKALRRENLVPVVLYGGCLLYTSPSPRDISGSRMPSSA